MNEITNKIKALIESEQEEVKDLEEFKNKTAYNLYLRGNPLRRSVTN